ncbi:MAG TPA: hypothetical protein VFV34_25055, partial [Blastocatellia bacterium]|nr:hypothetical protein [Blastocatellia bacterium]
MDREFTSEAGSRPRYRLRILSQFLLTAGLLIITSCSKVEKRSVDNRTEETGAEPRRYSALIIRTIRDGDDEFTTETRIARDGELSRQEWTENGERRVSILRPDLGKAFTLSIERAIYTESPTDWMSANTQDGNAVSAKESHREGSAGIDPQAIDRALALPPDPDSLEI